MRDASDGNEVGFADGAYGGIRPDGVEGNAPADLRFDEGGDHFQRFGEHIGRHIVEHDAVDPADDGLADFVEVAAFHFDGRARIVTPAQQFDGFRCGCP